LSEFHDISQIWEATTAKQVKIDPYYQRWNCSQLNVLFSGVNITSMLVFGRSSARGLQSKYIFRKWPFSASKCEYISQKKSSTITATVNLPLTIKK